MRYVQLRAFHHVATTGGFSRAAEALHLTQPAISDQVRKLEEEYEVQLFNRIRRQITLTAEGEALLAITRRFFEVEREALEMLSERRALREGYLRIIADAPHHLLHILGRFRQRYPSVRVIVQSGNTDTVIEALYRYEADVGVLGELPTGQDLTVLPLSSSPIIAFAAHDHPAAARGRLRLPDLADLPLVFREQGSRTRAKLEQAAAAAGLTLVPAIEAEGREAVRELVAGGAGVGFVSAAEFGQDTRLTPIPLDNVAGMTMDEALVCLTARREGRLLRAFLAMARDVQDNPPD
ncbi:MAG: LysR family transcriptional regulator [Rhodobacteraceae bacterium]|nr:LysR family transcriptional regulator [Paracoccaceae bacterium]